MPIDFRVVCQVTPFHEGEYTTQSLPQGGAMCRVEGFTSLATSVTHTSGAPNMDIYIYIINFLLHYCLVIIGIF